MSPKFKVLLPSNSTLAYLVLVIISIRLVSVDFKIFLNFIRFSLAVLLLNVNIYFTLLCTVRCDHLSVKNT